MRTTFKIVKYEFQPGKANKVHNIFSLNSGIKNPFAQKNNKTPINYNKNIYFNPEKKGNSDVYANAHNIVETLASTTNNSNSTSKGSEPQQLLTHIPCMNCGNSISIDEIEAHSLKCVQPIKIKDKREEIDFRLTKLRESIKATSPYNLRKIINYINQALTVKEIKIVQLKELKVILKGIDDLYNKYKKTYFNSEFQEFVSIERARVLINEKFRIFRDIYKEKTKLNNNENKSELYQSIYMKASKFKQNKIQDISSEVENSSGLSNKSVTSMSSNFSQRDSFPLFKGDTFSSSNEEFQNKSLFYKLVLKTKFEKLHSTHLGQKVPQKKIYQQALLQKIPKENWKDFILKELNNPKKYLEESKPRGHRGAKSVPKFPMDIIVEE